MEIEEKYLPIGTIVLLKGAEKKIMITGFCVKEKETDEKMYDYTGCMYPEGVVSADQNLVFDHEQIGQVFFKGCVTDEEKEFKQKLNEYLKKNEAEGSNGSIEILDSSNI